jgi:CRP-like cAMP-binding protein
MPNNRRLRSLPTDEWATLQRCLASVPLHHRSILNAMDHPIREVYFVESGIVSLVRLAQSGGGIETGVVGPEGLVGGFIAMGHARSPVQAAVQIAGRAFKCSAASFLDAYESMRGLRALVNADIGNLLLQAQQNALCHAMHSIEARLCRRILQTQDLTGSKMIDLTQEFLSNMLGVQRTSVSIIAHTLQQSGLIRYRRGHIEILDRQRLEQHACKCYSANPGPLEEIDALDGVTPPHDGT